jgi:N-acetylmuramoyl-L-alanine amidase
LRRELQLILITLLLLALCPAAEEKRLAVYTAQTNFTILVIDHDGQEYVSVTDLVDPFGSATLTHKGDRWKLRLEMQGKTTEAEFREGNDTATVRGKTIHLSRPFWADGQRGYVPVASTAVLMAQFTHQSTNFRENSRRLFVGDVSTTYTAEIAKASPNKLVLHFSAPVNPEVSTEPGRVRLSFNREPLIPSGSNPQSFDSAEIRSSTFSESNGGAEIAIATAAPTQAAFSDGGRTITLTATLPVAQAAAPEKPVAPATPSASSPAATASAPPRGTTAAQAPAPPRFVVIIDPAHGGDDPGATLGDGLLEKDVTMAIARRIRADLDQRGIAVVLLRDGDSMLTLDQRAAAANAAHAALYLGIHATTFGTGVHLYSARFNADVKPAAVFSNHGFLPWDSAQAAFLNASHNLEASLVTEFESRQIHSMPLESGLRPLRNIAKPAIVVEVAEPEHFPEDVKEGLSSVAYQQSVAAAVGSGIANLRGTMEAR